MALIREGKNDIKKGGEIMPVYDLTEISGVHEWNGTFRCIECISEDDDYWTNFNPSSEQVITVQETEDPDRLYVCDICNEIL